MGGMWLCKEGFLFIVLEKEYFDLLVCREYGQLSGGKTSLCKSGKLPTDFHYFFNMIPAGPPKNHSRK
jgi:hypothetical protein